MSACHSVWLPACFSVYLCTFRLCTCLAVYVYACQHACLPTYLSFCVHVCLLPVCLSICLPEYIPRSACLPEYLFSVSAHCQHTCLPVYMSTCLSVCLSTMDCLLFRRKPSIAVSTFCLFRIRKCNCSQLTLRYVLYKYSYTL